jgi:hypothetical protein
MSLFISQAHASSQIVIEVKYSPIGKITKSQFRRSLYQNILRAGYNKLPNNQVEAKEIKDAAVNDLLDQAWLVGEGKEKGIKVNKKAIKKEFKNIFKNKFQGKRILYKKFLKSSGLNHQEIMQRIKLMIISKKLEMRVINSGQTMEDFIEQYNRKWSDRTTCQLGYEVVSRCSNFQS